MRVRQDSVYALKDLYEEISFLDRKIGYCKNYEAFDSEDTRAAALEKLKTKREPLVKAALAMAGRGVECDPKYLPRSIRESSAPAEATT